VLTISHFSGSLANVTASKKQLFLHSPVDRPNALQENYSFGSYGNRLDNKTTIPLLHRFSCEARLEAVYVLNLIMVWHSSHPMKSRMQPASSKSQTEFLDESCI
jgi:hypothetical protein